MNHQNISGLDLAKRYYHEVVKDLIEGQFPNLAYACGFFGHGSDVLGYDDHISKDHNWGPKLFIFLKEGDYERITPKLDASFKKNLPARFLDFSTNWGPPNLEDNGTQQLEDSDNGVINHKIEFFTIKSYMQREFGFFKFPLETLDWLTIPQQKLLELTSGEVFFDNFNDLTELRAYFSFYPEQVRIFCLRGEWGEIQQMMAFTGRTGYVNDDLGSRLVATGQIKRMMKIAFLLEKQYAPYLKWFGTAFNKLSLARNLSPLFHEILMTDDWDIREKKLIRAYQLLADEHIRQNLIPAVEILPQPCHTRPQTVINSSLIIEPLKEKMSDEFRSIPHIGSINQFIENTDIIEYRDVYSKLISFENFLDE